MQTRRGATRAFTLIEVLIVMAIIGVLVAIAIPGLLRSRLSANESAALSDVCEAFMEAC